MTNLNITSMANPVDQDFKRGFRLSLIVHSIFIILSVLVNLRFFQSQNKITYIPSIRVDLVALPDVKKQDLDQIIPSEEANLEKPSALSTSKTKTQTPIVKDTVSLKKNTKKESLKKAIERMKALSDIENELKKDKPKAKVVIKGNQISKGLALSGSSSEDRNIFIDKLTGKIRENWNLPLWLSKQDLRAQVVIFFDSQGYVSSAIVAKSSGNKQFDDFAVKSVKSAQPFGVPPAEILEGGITLGFPL